MTSMTLYVTSFLQEECDDDNGSVRDVTPVMRARWRAQRCYVTSLLQRGPDDKKTSAVYVTSLLQRGRYDERSSVRDVTPTTRAL